MGYRGPEVCKCVFGDRGRCVSVSVHKEGDVYTCSSKGYVQLHSSRTSSKPSEAMGVLVMRGRTGSGMSGPASFAGVSRLGRGLSSSSGREKEG